MTMLLHESLRHESEAIYCRVFSPCPYSKRKQNNQVVKRKKELQTDLKKEERPKEEAATYQQRMHIIASQVRLFWAGQKPCVPA